MRIVTVCGLWMLASSASAQRDKPDDMPAFDRSAERPSSLREGVNIGELLVGADVREKIATPNLVNGDFIELDVDRLVKRRIDSRYTQVIQGSPTPVVQGDPHTVISHYVIENSRVVFVAPSEEGRR